MTRSLNLAPSICRRQLLLFHSSSPNRRSFRSNAALEALAKALILYSYPSFSAAFSALFVHLFHSQLNLPCLILPFSSVAPLRVDDLCIEGLEKCYLLDFLGPKGFAAELSRLSMRRGRVSLIRSVIDQDRVEMVLKYVKDGDLRHWSLSDIKAYNLSIRTEWHSKLNCITNPHMYEQAQ